MKLNQPIIPIALDAFFSLENGIRMAAWDLLKDKSNWLEEPGSDLEESIYYVAAFEERWGDGIDAGIYQRIVRMLEPYRETEFPEWLSPRCSDADDLDEMVGDGETEPEQWLTEKEANSALDDWLTEHDAEREPIEVLDHYSQLMIDFPGIMPDRR